MSAHAQLKTMAAARAAMSELLRRLGRPDLETSVDFDLQAGTATAWIRIPIRDELVNDATRVDAKVFAICEPGKRAKMATIALHTDGETHCWQDIFRFQTPSGSGVMAPRTLAPMLLVAMGILPA
jgi:hypothetical protein